MTTRNKHALNHVFRDAIDLLLRLHVRDRIEVNAAIAFHETRSDAFQLLPVFGRSRVILVPNEVEHLLDTNLYPHSI